MNRKKIDYRKRSHVRKLQANPRRVSARAEASAAARRWKKAERRNAKREIARWRVSDVDS